MDMKTIIVITFAAISITSCRNVSEKHRHHELFNQYSDSFQKYIQINSECARGLSKEYYRLSKVEYALLYPNGNPANQNIVKVKDTVCYPIK